MNTMLWAALGVAIGLLPLLGRFWQRSAAADADEEPTHEPPARGPRPALVVDGPAPATPRGTAARKFHGVSLKPGPNPCPAVLAVLDRRYLPDSAPSLPLPGCDQQACRCGYRHHGDRRDQDDRRSGWGDYGGFAPSIPGGNPRAKARDRRRKSAPAPTR